MNKTVELEIIQKRRKSAWIEHLKQLEQETQAGFEQPTLTGVLGPLGDPCGPSGPEGTAEISECFAGDTFDDRIVPAGENQWGVASHLHGNAWDVQLMGYLNGVNFSAVGEGKGYIHIGTAPDGGSFDNMFIDATQWSGLFPVEITARWRGTTNTDTGIFLTAFGVTGGFHSIQIDHVIDEGVFGLNGWQSELSATLSDGTDFVQVTSQKLSSWQAQYLHFKVKVFDPSTIGIKYWNGGQIEPDYIISTDPLVAFDPILLTEMGLSTLRPSQGDGENESPDIFYLDYLAILDGYACSDVPIDWWLLLFGDYNATIDPNGYITGELPLGNQQIINAILPEIANTNTFKLPTPALYVTDVWFDGLHTKPETDWTFIAPQTVQVIPILENNIQISAKFVVNSA